MGSTRILVVEDDLRMQRLLESQLTTRGYTVQVVESGDEALRIVADQEPDLMLLDISLPGTDGLEVCRSLREWSDLPVILVTAADMPQTKVTALELGADDYLTKPFHMGELVAQIRAVLRRAATKTETQTGIIKADDLEIDLIQRMVTRSGEEVRLTKIEFDLLRELAENADRVLTYQQLLDAVWGHGYEDVRPVHVHICNLRRKLEKGPMAHRHILSVPEIGYRLRLRDP